MRSPSRNHHTGFESFRDGETAPYYRSELRRLSPEQTWVAIDRRLLGLMRGIHARTSRGPATIDPVQLDRWHAYLFGRDFTSAGRIRRGRVTYPVLVTDADGGPRERLQEGTPPDRIRCELRRLCRAFERHIEAVQADDGELNVIDGASAAAEFYVGVLRIHPYEDGNGRLSFAVLQAALRSQGMYAVVFEDVVRHDQALGWALRDDVRDVRPLVDLIVELGAAAGRRRE